MAIDVGRYLRGLTTRLVVEPMKGWWSEEPGFGQQKVFPDGITATGVSEPMLDVALPGPPRPIAVQLYRSDRSVSAAGAGELDVLAEVEYGGGGVSNTFRCDWRSGTAFTVVGKWIRVNYVPRSVFGLAAGNRLAGLVLGATVGQGATQRAPATFTQDPIRDFATGFSMQMPIPDFATGFQLMALGPVLTEPNYALIDIEFRTANNTTFDLVNADTVIGALSSPDGYRVPAVAQFVSVQNRTGADVRMQGSFVLGI